MTENINLARNIDIINAYIIESDADRRAYQYLVSDVFTRMHPLKNNQPAIFCMGWMASNGYLKVLSQDTLKDITEFSQSEDGGGNPNILIWPTEKGTILYLNGGLESQILKTKREQRLNKTASMSQIAGVVTTFIIIAWGAFMAFRANSIADNNLKLLEEQNQLMREQNRILLYESGYYKRSQKSH